MRWQDELIVADQAPADLSGAGAGGGLGVMLFLLDVLVPQVTQLIKTMGIELPICRPARCSPFPLRQSRFLAGRFCSCCPIVRRHRR
jgi:hypothetical protein